MYLFFFTPSQLRTKVPSGMMKEEHKKYELVVSPLAVWTIVVRTQQASTDILTDQMLYKWSAIVAAYCDEIRLLLGGVVSSMHSLTSAMKLARGVSAATTYPTKQCLQLKNRQQRKLHS